MKDTLAVRVRFGAFELDLHTGELHGGGETVQLGEKPFRVLLILTEREGELATREEIQKKLWPNDTVVDFEHGINAAIKSLRRALGDSADHPKYIETLARHGYRLIVPVEWVNAGKDGEGQGLRPAVLTGRTVSHYRVLDIIGGGGMGVVYRAEDLKLGRQVALKFLPEELGGDPEALERFSREARAASSLDHPNICSIHEFGEHEGRPFMVMQLLEGQTLRDRVAREELALLVEELLDIGIQVSEGLQAAHEKGIIHRDIKPANIFLTSKGVVKILDFGLAKLMEVPEAEAEVPSPDLKGRGLSRAVAASSFEMGGVQPPPGLNPAQGNHSKCPNGTPEGVPLQNASPAEHTLTCTGLPMGTAGYMSPEQVRGERLDARTDIFSFGLVLYEMATGKRAFTGQTAAVVQEAIVSRNPVTVHNLNSTLPPKLETLIDKALEKERERRYQSAAELGGELQRVRAETEARKNRRWPLWVAVAALIAVGVLWFVRSGTTVRPEAHEQQLTASPPDNPVTGAAISPDGKYVAYHDQMGLYLRAIDSGETRPVALPADLPSRLFTLCWSPTGGKLLAEVGSSDGWDIWVIPLQGDAKPHLLYRNAGEPSVSPDGQRVVFVSYGFRRFEKEIWLGDLEGQTPRNLVTSEEEQLVFAPEWSPDSRWIAYGRRWKTAQGAWSSDIEIRPAEGGPAKTLLAESSLPKSNTLDLRPGMMFTQTWLPDWRLVFRVRQGSLAYGPERKRDSLWQVWMKPRTAEVTGNPERLTQWWTGYTALRVSAAADGKRLAVLKRLFLQDVYVGVLAENGASMKPPQRVTLDQRGSNLNSWTLDGQILFDSVRNGRREIFRQGPNEMVAEKIVSSTADVYGGAISPVGKWLLYNEAGSPGGVQGTIPESSWLMRRAIEGGKAEKVMDLSHVEVNDYACSRNPKASSPCVLALMKGKNVVFYSLDPIRGKGRQLGTIEVTGRRAAFMGWNLSPDGSKVALVDKERYGANIEMLRLADGTWHEIAVKSSVGHLYAIGWAADGQSFFVMSITPGGHSLLHVSMNSKAEPLWHVLGGGRAITAPFASPDGKYVAFNGETWDSNVWMIDNF